MGAGCDGQAWERRCFVTSSLLGLITGHGEDRPTDKETPMTNREQSQSPGDTVYFW
jgi:hypothetical protein